MWKCYVVFTSLTAGVKLVLCSFRFLKLDLLFFETYSITTKERRTSLTWTFLTFQSFFSQFVPLRVGKCASAEDFASPQKQTGMQRADSQTGIFSYLPR